MCPEGLAVFGLGSAVRHQLTSSELGWPDRKPPPVVHPLHCVEIETFMRVDKLGEPDVLLPLWGSFTVGFTTGRLKWCIPRCGGLNPQRRTEDVPKKRMQ